MSGTLCDVRDLVNDSISHSHSLSVAARTIHELRCFLMALDIDTPHLSDAVAAIDRSQQDPLIAAALAEMADDTLPEIILPVPGPIDDTTELNGIVGF